MNDSTPITSVEQIIKAFKNTVASLEKLDHKKVNVAFSNLKSISIYLEDFFEITTDIYGKLEKYTERIKSVDNGIVIKAQESIVKVLSSSMDLFKAINDMEFNNTIGFKYKLFVFRRQFISLLDTIFNTRSGIAAYINSIDNGGEVEILENGKLIKRRISNIKNLQDSLSDFSDIIDSIRKSIDDTYDFSNDMIKKYITISLGFKTLTGKEGLFSKFNNLFDTPEFKKLGYKRLSNLLSSVSENINQFNGIIDQIVNMSSSNNMSELILVQRFILPVLISTITDLSEFNVPVINAASKKPYFDNVNLMLGYIMQTIVELSNFDVDLVTDVIIANVTIRMISTRIVDTLKHFESVSSELRDIKIQKPDDTLENIKLFIDSLTDIVKGILLISLSAPVLLVAQPAAVLTSFLISAFIKTTITELQWIAGRKTFRNLITSSENLAIVVTAILASMIIATAGIVVLAMLGVRLTSVWKPALFTIFAISVVLVAIAGLAVIINKIFSGGISLSIYSGLLAMIEVIGVMLLVTGQLMLFAYAGLLMFGENWEGGLWPHAAAMFGMVATTTLLIGGIGYLLTLMLPGILAFTVASVSLLISIGAMLLVAGMLVGLAEFEFEEETQEKVREKTRLIINTAHDIMNAMFRGWTKEGEDYTSNESEDSGFKRFFKGLFQGSAMIVETLASSLVLVMTFVSVTMLLATAAMLEVIGKVDLNSSTITSNVGMVIGVAHGVIDAVLNKETPTTNGTPEDKKGPIRSLLSGVGDVFKGIKNIIDGVLSFGFIAFTMVSIGMITLIAKNLKYLEEIKLDQKTVEAKVQAVVGTANSLINHINESNINKGDVKKAGLTRDFMKQIEKTVGHMSKIGEMNNQGQFDKAIDSYVRFVDKINTVKLENLQTATNMFEKMAEFSKSISGNFEGLADSINDKIMPLLEQLNEGLNKTNENIENGSFGVTTVASGSAAPANVPTGTPATAAAAAAPQKDYSRILGEIKQEISKMQKILTDGSQVTVVDTQ